MAIPTTLKISEIKITANYLHSLYLRFPGQVFKIDKPDGYNVGFKNASHWLSERNSKLFSKDIEADPSGYFFKFLHRGGSQMIPIPILVRDHFWANPVYWSSLATVNAKDGIFGESIRSAINHTAEMIVASKPPKQSKTFEGFIVLLREELRRECWQYGLDLDKEIDG